MDSFFLGFGEQGRITYGRPADVKASGSDGVIDSVVANGLTFTGPQLDLRNANPVINATAALWTNGPWSVGLVIQSDSNPQATRVCWNVHLPATVGSTAPIKRIMCGLYDSAGAELGARLGDDNDGVVTTYTGWGGSTSAPAPVVPPAPAPGPAPVRAPAPVPSPIPPAPSPGLVPAPSPSSGSACSETWIQSPSPFMGKTGELVKLGDGTLWEVGLSLELLLALSAPAVICPSTGELLVEGKTIPVTQITEYVESRIDGAFTGFAYETVFNLSNGQIWQQIDSTNSFENFYASVIIYRSRTGTLLLKVEGIDDTVRVRRLQ